MDLRYIGSKTRGQKRVREEQLDKGPLSLFLPSCFLRVVSLWFITALINVVFKFRDLITNNCLLNELVN
jgi:hypothetical protein